MELRHLRYFLALAEELHFSRAAQRLAISQPPLSVAVQQLEARVGVPLFVRNSRGVQLTAAGQALVPQARAVLAQAARAVQEARDAAAGQAGRLTVGFAGTMLYRGLPRMLQRFQAEHPRLAFSLRELGSSAQVVALQHGRLDAGFVHALRVPAGLSQLLVASQPFMACVPAAHPLARKRTVALAQLVDTSAPQRLAVVARSVSPDYHERITAWWDAAGAPPGPVHELQHWLSVVSLVAQGLAVALVPAALRQAGIAGAAFVALAEAAGDADQAPRYETHCLWQGGADHPALAAFLAAVAEVARG